MRSPKSKAPKATRPRPAQFGPPPTDGTSDAQSVVVSIGKPKRERKPKVKNDPKHVAAARELRDRYLEQFNAGQVVGGGKYDVARALPSVVQPLHLSEAA